MTDKNKLNRDEITPLPCKDCEYDETDKVCTKYSHCPAWRGWFAREFARVTQVLRRCDDGIGDK